MESLEKLRILLQHWIDHNEGHAAEYEKWQHVAAHEGTATLAGHIAGAIEEMAKVNRLLEKALHEAGGPASDDGSHHHHHHHHH
jgi:hypothetical protein